MKISEDDLKQLFDSDNEFLGPDDDWEGFEIKEMPDKEERIRVKKADRKIENEITIKKIRKKIAKVPERKGATSRGRIIDQFLKLLAFAGISGFLVFVFLNFPAYISQLKWLYYTEYLGERMPGADTSRTPLAQISQNSNLSKTKIPPAKTKTPSPSSSQTSAPNPFPESQNILKIDAINVKAPIVWNVDEADILENLQNGVVHYKGTSLPGEGGNVFIVGHSSNFPWANDNFSHVFSLLGKLVNGNRISINYGGRTLIYETVEKKIVSANSVEVLNSTNQEVLSLMTCWPVGTTLNRLIIVSKLVQIL